MNSVLVFDSKPYEKEFLDKAATDQGLKLQYLETRLTESTVNLASGYKVICCFVNDDLSAPVLRRLSEIGIELILLRCAGFNNVDGNALKELPLKVARVPEYSPQSVAEFALALLMNVSRKIHKSYSRTRDMNFTLNGLIGFDLNGKTIGVVGTGKIGCCFVKLLQGFGSRILALDPNQNESLKDQVTYTDKDQLITESDIIVLHAPLTKETHHFIDIDSIEKMKPGSIIVNTSRGGLIDTKALIQGLKSKKLAGAALDVYEEESEFFFQDFSEQILDDDVLARLMTFPNVIVTSHQGYLTENALREISSTVSKQARQFFDKSEIIFLL